MPKHYTIPIFIPELACPFQCVFCNQRKITGKELIPDDATIIATVNNHLGSFKEQNRVVEIGFFGGSFTGLDLDQQRHYLELAKPFLDRQQVNGIRLSTRPDYISDEVLNLLHEYGVSTIELGAQSTNDEVLRASHRGHTFKQIVEASGMIRNHGFFLGLQMMIGLPGDTLARSIETAEQIIKLKADNTRIYPTVVIRNTALNKWYEDGKYTPLSLEQAVDWASKLLTMFEDAGIKVIRVGLHPSEGLVDGTDLVAGPFHPSFKELVLTRIWRKSFESLIQLKERGKLEIIVPEKELNYAIGYQSSNRSMLEKMFSGVRIKSDAGLAGRKYHYKIS